jgi:hypothetical protein
MTRSTAATISDDLHLLRVIFGEGDVCTNLTPVSNHPLSTLKALGTYGTL